MTKSVSRQTFDALMPPGPLWVPEDGEGLDQLIEGIADNSEDIAGFLAQLANIRNPALTTLLSDLEKEYGIATDTNLTEAVRRMRLATKAFGGTSNGSIDVLQAALDSSGFTQLTVYENNPAVDPAIFLDQIFRMIANGDNAYAGFVPVAGPPSTAYAGRIGGELLVNGDIFSTTSGYLSQAGGAWAGGLHGYAGRFDEMKTTKLEYSIPTDPDDWPLVFFVGGAATFNPDGSLLTIVSADVDVIREQKLKRTILSIKPIHSWAGLVITFN